MKTKTEEEIQIELSGEQGNNYNELEENEEELLINDWSIYLNQI